MRKWIEILKKWSAVLWGISISIFMEGTRKYVEISVRILSVQVRVWTWLHDSIKSDNLLRYTYVCVTQYKDIYGIITDLYLCTFYVGFCIICCLIVICFVSLAVWYVLITRFRFLLLFILCMFSCFVCFAIYIFVFCVLFCVLFLLMYIAFSFIFVYKFTDHCHRLET